MATVQQLPSTLPPGWESDYDGTSERWFFIHRPTGFSQFFFPKAGDEHTRLAELAQPQPSNGQHGSFMVKMEALSISGDAKSTIQSQQTALLQQVSPTPPTSAPQPALSPQPLSQSPPIANPQPAQSPQLQQGPQGSPIGRTVSQTVQRKAIPRRGSTQSQVSTRSAQSTQSAAQPALHVQPLNLPSVQQNAQSVQNPTPSNKAIFPTDSRFANCSKIQLSCPSN
jgi:hypothetical protein